MTVEEKGAVLHAAGVIAAAAVEARHGHAAAPTPKETPSHPAHDRPSVVVAAAEARAHDSGAAEAASAPLVTEKNAAQAGDAAEAAAVDGEDEPRQTTPPQGTLSIRPPLPPRPLPVDPALPSPQGIHTLVRLKSRAPDELTCGGALLLSQRKRRSCFFPR